MLEPLSYSLDENKKLSSDEKRYVVTETARRLTPLYVDILKAEFPLDVNDDESNWMDACREISASSTAPWILLSAAVDYERTLILSIEVSNQSWVLAAQVPGLPHTKAKRTVDPEAEGHRRVAAHAGLGRDGDRHHAHHRRRGQRDHVVPCVAHAGVEVDIG